MRLPIITANWKMHKSIWETEDFVAKYPKEQGLFKGAEVVICPPFTALHAAGQALKGTGLKLGAQNMYPEDKGAFTGEISPVMLRDLACEYVILGHSERRQIFGEDDSFVNRKIKAAIHYKIKPILCIGETLEQRRLGETQAVCRKQLRGSLAGIEPDILADLVVAYEPVWAIGTGVNASPEEAQAAIKDIRDTLGELFGREAAQRIRIQYGGSVKPDNIRQIMAGKDIDGALVGGASLEAESFYQIVQGVVD
jgi:triosephosphate isomerase